MTLALAATTAVCLLLVSYEHALLWDLRCSLMASGDEELVLAAWLFGEDMPPCTWVP